MTDDNDVNAIFEKHTIEEIEDLLSKMRNDIEKKKEDLRIMVGERYRDLIEAADTISAMRDSAEAICGNVVAVEGLCESLQQRGLIGFKTRVVAPSGDSNRAPPPSHQYSLAIQVKLLVDVPEILWGLTERKEYLDAAQLFLLVQQAHTALQLSPNASEMLDKFPVISRQWSSISQFRSTIAKGCVALIRDEIRDLQLVLEAVAATMLLEGRGAAEALRGALHLRREALAGCLLQHDATPSAVAMTTLPAFVALCVASFRAVHFVFASPHRCDGKTCRLEQTLLAVSGEPSDHQATLEPPISLLYESSLGLSFLPKAVVEFRPKPRGKFGTLTTNFIQEEMRHWFASVVPEASRAVAQLLSCTTSVKALALIRNVVWEGQRTETSQQNWNHVTRCVLDEQGFSPWEAVIRKEALARAQKLVRKELKAACESSLQMVTNLTSEIHANSRVCAEEGDVSEFLWTEAVSDLPDQSAWASLAARSAVGGPAHDKIGLFYKSRGYTRRVQNVCRALNAKMAAILEDVSNYVPDSLRSEDLADHGEEERGALVDYDTLLKFLQDETVEISKGFLSELESIAAEHMKDLETDTEDPLGKSGMSQPPPGVSVVITISRLAQAVPLVCPQLKVCVGATLLGRRDTARRLTLGMQPDTQAWLDLAQQFSEKSTSLMSRFLSLLARLFVAQMMEDFSVCIKENNPESLLLLFTTWDRVQIEEESETGSVIQSAISIPAHPSPPLSAALTKTCSALNSICAHTVSRASQMELVTSLCSELTSAYECFASGTTELNQVTALQLIFDLKLLQNVLLPRENKDLGTRALSLIQRLESRVDPFDLDVFSSHLNTRVKMASQRLLVLLGTIIPKEKQPFTVKGVISSSGNNTLPVVSSVEIPRFSNVPLASFAIPRRASLLLLSDSVESHLKGSHDNSTTGSVTSSHTMATAAVTASRSAASSLFSAVSSSWFGGAS